MSGDVVGGGAGLVPDEPVVVEVAGSKPAAGAAAGGGFLVADTSGDTVDMDAPQGRGSGSLFGRQRRRATPPIVLRVPPGYVVVAVLVLAGLIVLAFWVGKYLGAAGGYRRGYEQRRAEVESMRPQGSRLGAAAAVVGPIISDNPVIDSGLGPVGDAGGETGSSVDSRQVGLNYWILLRVPPDEAERACGFLRGHGVDSFVHPLENTGLCHVIALRGFTGDDESARQYQAELKKLGRIWKSEHRGTDAFVSMYLSKYKSPTGR